MTAEKLMSLTVTDLRALAERHGVSGHARMRKDQLIGALLPVIAAGSPIQNNAKGNAAAKVTMPVAAGSSSSSSRPSPGPSPASNPSAPGPNPGLPIPERYGSDRLVLLMQDAHHIFAYWEITPETFARVAAKAGANAAHVLILHAPSGLEQRDIDLRGGNYYLSVCARRTVSCTPWRCRISSRRRWPDPRHAAMRNGWESMRPFTNCSPWLACRATNPSARLPACRRALVKAI